MTVAAPTTLRERLARSEASFAQTGAYQGLAGALTLKARDPILYEKLFSRLRGGLVSARETALDISASPIVKELGELCFALYTPEGDCVALSTGIIVHVHTMSEAIKYMIRQGYEDNPGIEPGDVFCNNDSSIGGVHNADVQTIVPIFHDGALAGWVGGVTHVIEIGARTPGSLPLGPISRFEDGIDIPARKIGADDELFRDHVLASLKGTRSPRYWTLDERTRLAGCLIAREQVAQVIAEVGLEVYESFTREVIEDGRRAFKARVLEMTVPGVYRAPAFSEVTLAQESQLSEHARVDTLMHAPVEVRITADARLELDLEGASSWGYHSANCTPSAMQGALWVLLTQTLICNDKINDGAYHGIATNLPPGSWANHQNPLASTGSPWRFLVPSFTGVLMSISRSLQARGFVEEVVAAYGMSANTFQGGGIDHHGRQSSVTNFAISCVGAGARMIGDGLDHAAAMWNPQGDMGDCETWELSEPFLFLGAAVKPCTAGPGRFRGGSGWEALRLCWGTPFFETQNMGNGPVFIQAGLWGGYPAATGYRHNVRDTDLLERARRGLPYPVRDGDPEDSEIVRLVQGHRDFDQRTLTMPEAMAEGDLYLSVYRGGAGLGDPLEREPTAVQADLDGGYLLGRIAESVYGARLVDGRVDPAGTARRRADLRRARARASLPVRDWMATERERLLAHVDPARASERFIVPVQRMYAESMRLSPAWAREFRRFWSLPEDFEFPVATPTVDISRRLLDGSDPEELQRQPRSEHRGPMPSRDGDLGQHETLAPAELEALLEGRVTGARLRAIQSGYKDPRRFDAYLEVLQRRVGFKERIVLPFGLHLYVVENAEGRLVVKSDSGFEFGDYRENWKLNARIRVRRTRESFREIYPDKMHGDPDWNEIREYLDPADATLLSVEVVPPGYPVVHEFVPDLEAFYRDWLGRPVPGGARQ